MVRYDEQDGFLDGVVVGAVVGAVVGSLVTAFIIPRLRHLGVERTLKPAPAEAVPLDSTSLEDARTVLDEKIAELGAAIEQTRSRMLSQRTTASPSPDAPPPEAAS